MKFICSLPNPSLTGWAEALETVQQVQAGSPILTRLAEALIEVRFAPGACVAPEAGAGERAGRIVAASSVFTRVAPWSRREEESRGKTPITPILPTLFQGKSLPNISPEEVSI